MLPLLVSRGTGDSVADFHKQSEIGEADALFALTLMPPSIVNPIPPTTRAAQYVRMSTEHQQYSRQNQFDTITKGAIAHNMDIVGDTYDDRGGEAGSNPRGPGWASHQASEGC